VLRNDAFDRFIEALRPLRRVGRSSLRAPERVPKIVDHIATSENQDALVAQLSKRSAKLVVARSIEATVDAQLDDGDVCPRSTLQGAG
jgi:hypothetical protein